MSRAFTVVCNEATPPGNVEVITQLLLNLAESLATSQNQIRIKVCGYCTNCFHDFQGRINSRRMEVEIWNEV